MKKKPQYKLMAAHGGPGREDTSPSVYFITDVDKTLIRLSEASTEFSENLAIAFAHLQERFKSAELRAEHLLFTSRDLRSSVECADYIRKTQGAAHLPKNLFFLGNLLAHLRSVLGLDFAETAPIIQVADGLIEGILGHGYAYEHQTMLETKIEAILAELDAYYESLPPPKPTTMKAFYNDLMIISETTYKPTEERSAHPYLPLYLQLAHQHLDNVYAHAAETDASITYGDKRFMLAKLFAKYGADVCFIWTDDCEAWYYNALNETKFYVEINGRSEPLGSLVARCVVFVPYDKFNCNPEKYYQALRANFFADPRKPILFPEIAKILAEAAATAGASTELRYDPAIADIMIPFNSIRSTTPVSPEETAKILAEAEATASARARAVPSIVTPISPIAATATPMLQALSDQQTPSTVNDEAAAEVSDDEVSIGRADSDNEAKR